MASISEAHSNAARVNGALSHGPITEEGKARSSHNATTHGLTAQTVVVEPEEMYEYLASVKEYFAFIRPVGPIEDTLCKRMIDATWNVRRAGLLEVKLKEKAGEDPLISSDRYIYRQAINLQRHKNTHTRIYDRAWKELQALQSLRKREEEEARRNAPQEEARKEAEEKLGTIRTEVRSPQRPSRPYGPRLRRRRKGKSLKPRPLKGSH